MYEVTMSRRTARENVYRLTFEFLFYNTKNDTTLDVLLSDSALTNEDKIYITNVYDGIILHFDELKSLVEKYVEGYTIERVYKPDLAVMILCAYELKYMPEVPAPVAISEAIEIAERYSSEKSKSFVNGTLSSINKEINGTI
ncbi:MAG: transcription antitermination factor NusB [Clostridia bacterium]